MMDGTLLRTYLGMFLGRFMRNEKETISYEIQNSQELQLLSQNERLNNADQEDCTESDSSEFYETIISKNKEIINLTREKNQYKNELFSLKFELEEQKRYQEEQEKELVERMRLIESKLCDREQDVYKLRCDHLLGEIDNDIEPFPKKELLSKSFKEVENMIDDLNSHYIDHFRSVVLENSYLRNEIQSIDSNYCHQLDKVRSTSNNTNKLLTTRIKRAELERKMLIKTQTEIMTNKQIKNNRLQDEIMNLIEENRELNDKLEYLTKTSTPTLTKNNLESELKVESYDLSVAQNKTIQMENYLIEEQNSNTQLNDKMIMDLNKNRVEVKDTINYFEDLSNQTTTENNDLKDKSCKNVQILNNLKKEQRKSIELENEIKSLKDEIVLIKKATKEQINLKKLNDKIISLKQENAEMKSVLQKYKGRISPKIKTDPKLKLGNGGKGDAKANKTIKVLDKTVNLENSITDKNVSNNHLIEMNNQRKLGGNFKLASKETLDIQSENHDVPVISNEIKNILLEDQKKDIQSNENTIVLTEIIFQVNEMLNQLESYLPNVKKVVENCKSIQMTNVLKEEQRENIKLKNDIVCLNDEIVNVKKGLKEQSTYKKINEKIVSLQQENAEVKFLMQRLKTRLPIAKKTNVDYKLRGCGKGYKGAQSLLPQSKILSLKRVPLKKDSNPKLENDGQDNIEANSISSEKQNTLEVPDQMTDSITEKNELSDKLKHLTLENECLTIKSLNIDLLENKLKEVEAKNIRLQNEIASLKEEHIRNRSLIMKPNQSIQIDKDVLEETSNIPENVSFSVHIEPQSASAAIRDSIRSRYFIHPIVDANEESTYHFVKYDTNEM